MGASLVEHPQLVAFGLLAITLVLAGLLLRPLSAALRSRRGPTPRHVTTLAVLFTLGALLPGLAFQLGFQAAAGSLWWAVNAAVLVATWKGLTAGLDPRAGLPAQLALRAAFLASATLALLLPWALPLWLGLAVGPMRLWSHHLQAALRLVFVAFFWLEAWAVVRAVVGAGGTQELKAALGAGLLLSLSATLLVHYLVPAVAKIRLGPRPWSWANECRFDHYVSSAYLWGFWRSRRPASMLRIVRALRPLNPLLGYGTLAIELMPLVAMGNRWLLVAALSGFVAMHLGIWLAAGVAFWESMLVCAVLGVAVVDQPAAVAHLAFGLGPMVITAGLLVGSARWRYPFDAAWLAWWTTRLSQNIFYEVQLPDGSWRTVPNTMLTPLDREFVFQRPMLRPRRSIVTYKGETTNYALHRALLDFDGSLQQLEAIRTELGFDAADPAVMAEHLDYLTARFEASNAGKAVDPLPRWLRWLEAPKQLYNGSGPNPLYRRGQQVVALRIRSREECLVDDERGFVLLNDEVVVERTLGSATGVPQT